MDVENNEQITTTPQDTPDINQNDEFETFFRKIHRLTPDLQEQMKVEKEYFHSNQIHFFNKALSLYKDLLELLKHLEYGTIQERLESSRQRKIEQINTDINKFLHPIYPPGTGTKQKMAEIDSFCEYNINALKEELKQATKMFDSFIEIAGIFEQIMKLEKEALVRLQQADSTQTNGKVVLIN